MKNEIIGGGMIANAFRRSNSDNCLFFCSGVSKSTEHHVSQFEEKKLLIKSIESTDKKCVVYFSSVLAPKESNAYYAHKKKMEDLVASISKQYLIIRLPQVAGSVVNDTLLPNFVKNIYFGYEFDIYKDAPRSIIDVDDVVVLYDIIYKEGVINKTLNLCPSYSFQPIELVRIISKHLMKEARYRIVDRESIQICESCTIVKKHKYVFGGIYTYLERVVKKYIDSITQELNKTNPKASNYFIHKRTNE